MQNEDFLNDLDRLRAAGWSWTQIHQEVCVTRRMVDYIRAGQRVPSPAVAKCLRLAVSGLRKEVA